jgi:hypothetical protein
VSLPEAITIDERAFQDCHVLETVSLPKVTSIGQYAFGYTGTTKVLTVTLGATVPTLGTRIFFGVGSTKAVTVRVPGNAVWSGIIGGSPYNETATFTGNWGNGFRGGGWSGSAISGSNEVNRYIILTVEALP